MTHSYRKKKKAKKTTTKAARKDNVVAIKKKRYVPPTYRQHDVCATSDWPRHTRHRPRQLRGASPTRPRPGGKRWTEYVVTMSPGRGGNERWTTRGARRLANACGHRRHITPDDANLATMHGGALDDNEDTAALVN